MWTWYNSVLTNIIDRAPNVKSFFLKVESDEVFKFQAGQFITLDLPIHEKRLKRWRSYSIANSPNDENIIELCIVLLPDGLGTNYLFNEVEIGDVIKFKGPTGAFVLPESVSSEDNLMLVATGTGIAPVRSIILDELSKGNKTPNIKLIFGTRKIEDILYYNEWKELSDANAKFSFEIALSREENNSDGFHQGYVHKVYKGIIENGEYYPDYIFGCGWNKMVDEMKEECAKMGLEKTKIILEGYG